MGKRSTRAAFHRAPTRLPFKISASFDADYRQHPAVTLTGGSSGDELSLK